MINKIITLYFSPTKTTKKLVQTIAGKMKETLESSVDNFDITLPYSRDTLPTMNEGDILLLGLPVYGGRIPPFLEQTLKSMKGNSALAVITAVYGNRDYDDALLEMKDILQENGFHVIAAGAFIGEHSIAKKLGTNRPNESDFKYATEFAEKVVEKIQNNTVSIEDDLVVKGTFPYKERRPSFPKSPKTKDNCTNCKLCSKICPMGAISFEDPTVIDDLKCINCFACVKLCPESSKYFDNEMILKMMTMLEENFSDPKEPEFFL